MLRGFALQLSDDSHVGEARRSTQALAHAEGLSAEVAGTATLVASELARNTVRHGQGGELLVRALSDREGGGLELLALDKGPGMADVSKCLVDGYSTAGTQGTGLGAIRRLSSAFDVYSRPGAGTVLLSRVGGAPAAGCEVGGVNLALAGEEVSGDEWAAFPDGPDVTLVVADGLGHGAQAQEAAIAAVRALSSNSRSPLEATVQRMHEALKPTRGAAVALARSSVARGELQFIGVGNISGVVLVEGARQGVISHSGTVGHEARRLQVFTYRWPKGALLVLHSDGVSAQWGFERYPGLAARHPSVIAGALLRDHRRVRDDATVVVMRNRPAQEGA